MCFISSILAILLGSVSGTLLYGIPYRPRKVIVQLEAKWLILLYKPF